MNFFYELLLTLHNLLRWVVLVVAILATVGAFMGWSGKRPWTERQRKLGSFTAIGMDSQFLIGLLLYIFGEYGIKAFGKGMAFVTANAEYRFFAMEHIALMLVAVVLGHLGSILPRKAQEPAQKYLRAALPFALMLVLILASIPWQRPLLRLFGVALP
jgi:hypothetical protein